MVVGLPCCLDWGLSSSKDADQSVWTKWGFKKEVRQVLHVQGQPEVQMYFIIRILAPSVDPEDTCQLSVLVI